MSIHSKFQELDIGQSVLVRSLCDGLKWVHSTVLEADWSCVILGSSSYLIKSSIITQINFWIIAIVSSIVPKTELQLPDYYVSLPQTPQKDASTNQSEPVPSVNEQSSSPHLWEPQPGY